MRFFAALGLAFTVMAGAAAPASAETYLVDTKGAHASINFAVSHLGFSFVTGRFDKFTGTFDYNAKNPAASKITIDIDTTSVNTNHAARDKHIRSADFLEVSKYPTAKFVSTGIKMTGNGTAMINGKLTMHGVTKDITIKANHIGGGKDPWGGFRHGFTGSATIPMGEYGVKKNFGDVKFTFHIEGIRQ